MTIGKNKKKPRKNAKAKKAYDSFSRKDWYNVRVPNIFPGGTNGTFPGSIGRTFVNKTIGIKTSEQALLGRVFSVSLADLNPNYDDRHKIIKLIVEHVQGDSVYTNFYGMRLTTDYTKSLVQKFQTLIEAHADIKTTDGAVLRLFAVTFTKRRPRQIKKTAYAQTTQVRLIRRKIIEVIKRDTDGADLKTVFEKLTSDIISKNIEREASGIYSLQNTVIRKVRLLKRPKAEIEKLKEFYSGHNLSSIKLEETGEAIIQAPAANNAAIAAQ